MCVYFFNEIEFSVVLSRFLKPGFTTSAEYTVCEAPLIKDFVDHRQYPFEWQQLFSRDMLRKTFLDAIQSEM